MKASAQLPLVDPDFRLVERRPERLHAYARGLLQHLREIRAGEKAGGYPIATIKAAAVWLIESYAEAVVAPAPEAALLVSEIVAFGQKIEAVEAIVPGVASSGAVPQSMPMHRGQLHLQKQA